MKRLIMSLLFVTAALILTIPSMVFAAEVKNVTVGQVGKNAVATYDLGGGEGETEAEVTVTITAGNDRLTSDKLHLTGDFGKGVKVGTGKKIVWDATKDLPADFDGDLSWSVESIASFQKGIAYVAGHGGHIAVINLKNEDVAFIQTGKPLFGILLSPDGNTIFGFTGDGYVKEISVITGIQTSWIKLGKKLHGSAFAPDGMIWTTDMNDGNIYIYDPKTHKLSDSFSVSKSTCGVSFSKDGKTAYIADMPGGFINIVDVDKKRVVNTIKSVGDFLHLSRTNHSYTELWQTDGKELKNGKLFGVGYADRGGVDGTVQIIDTTTLKLKNVITVVSGNITDIDFTPDDRYALVGSRQVPTIDDSGISIVDTKTEKILKTYSTCKKCHDEKGVTVQQDTDSGRSYLSAIQVNWQQSDIPNKAKR
ncbi:MAG: YncE family protein [Nitrospirae bacterium]|nr:YncE family protein [Nitrospirota bacterium]